MRYTGERPVSILIFLDSPAISQKASVLFCKRGRYRKPEPVFGSNLFLKGLMFQNLLSKERSFTKKGLFLRSKTAQAFLVKVFPRSGKKFCFNPCFLRLFCNQGTTYYYQAWSYKFQSLFSWTLLQLHNGPNSPQREHTIFQSLFS